MEKTKSQRGGHRDGAGRKSSGVKKVTVTLSFSPEIVEILRTKGRKQSAYLERLVMEDQEMNQ